jgi:purine nucleosidase
MGEYRNEIDDGLAILMLLGAGVELVGVTTSFGNGSLEQADRRTRELLRRVGREDVPVVRGAAHAGDLETPAAAFIAEMVGRYPKSLRILAIGPLTNLYGVLVREPEASARVAGVYSMGGYLKRLRFLRREVQELNLSADPTAAHAVLTAPWPVMLASAQLCLQARYGLRHLLAEWLLPSAAGAGFRLELRRRITEWFLVFGIHVGALGFYLWDLVPAWAILDPTRFIHRRAAIISTEDDLRRGILRLCDRSLVTEAGRIQPVIDAPRRIRRSLRFAGDCSRSWRRAWSSQEGGDNG